MKFEGTVTDRSWIESFPIDMDLKEKRKMFYDVKYIDNYDECLWLARIRPYQNKRYYMDEIRYAYPY